MAWTTPASWSFGEVVTASKMNTHVRDNLRYLKGLDGRVTLDDGLTLSGSLTAGTAVTISGTAALFRMIETDAGTNAGSWDIAADGGQLLFRAVNDALSSATNWMQITRSGQSPQTIAWLTAGVERMRLDASGRVGIGTNSPLARLHLTQNQGGAIFFAAEDIGATAVTVISGLPAATITRRVACFSNIVHSGGSAAGSGAANVGVGSTVLASDGTNSLTIHVTDTSIALQRTAGSGTYDVVLWLTYQ